MNLLDVFLRKIFDSLFSRFLVHVRLEDYLEPQLADSNGCPNIILTDFK